MVWLMDAWTSAEAHGWSDESLVEWRILRITPAGRDAILAKALAMCEPLAEPHDVAGASASQDTAVSWPWGTYKTKLLQDLAAAAERFWVRYDPSDATTAPVNADVAAWLQMQRGTSGRAAHSIATILRADGLPTGPRK